MIEHIIKRRSHWFLIFLLWTGVVLTSAWWNDRSLHHHAQIMATERGRGFYNLIVMTRQWNAQHGRVYVPITRQTPPNPYLELPDRDVLTTDGKQLTAINPAYMTRQLSEMAESQGIIFHLTSLLPLNPGNAPDPWEAAALKAFEMGKPEVIEMLDEEAERPIFRYMAPLRVEPSCMGCHAKQGYRIGDIRGGLSVNLDARPIADSLKSQHRSIVIIHASSWLIVTVLLFVFLNSIRKHTLFLEGVSVDQTQRLRDKSTQLEDAKDRLRDLVTRDTTTGIHTIEHFKTLSENAWVNAIRNRTNAAILLLEIDHFHDFTDNYGALEGDFCLKQVTAAITDIVDVRGSIIARYGAASFIVMLSDMNEKNVRDIAEQIHGAVIGLAIPHETSEVSRVVTITGAFSVARPKPGSTVTEHMRLVRDCLVNGKSKTRNKIYNC